MKTEDANNEIVVQEDDPALAKSSHTPGPIAKSFARQLRALGQALEKFSFSAFDLELRSASYLVIGRPTSIQHVKFSFSRFVSELLCESLSRPSVTSTDGQVDLRFSPQDIECFDLRGKSRRHDSSKMPDPSQRLVDPARRWVYSGSPKCRKSGADLVKRKMGDG